VNTNSTSTPSQLGFLQSSASGYIAVLIAASWWATSGLFVKFIASQADINSIALAFWRDLFTFGTLLVGMIILRPANLKINPRDLPQLAVMGASLGAFHVFWNLAVLLNGAAVATVQQAAMPAIVVIVARFVWREAITSRKLVAIVLTFAGTVLVSGIDTIGQAGFTISGLLVGLCLPIAYASWGLFGKGARKRYDAFVILTYGFAFGALALFPFQFFVPQPSSISMLAWLGFAGWIVQTIIAFVAYLFGLGRLPAGIASILAMSEIAFVAFYAYFLLGERLTGIQIGGVVLVVVGVLLLVERKQGNGASDHGY
jgi:drug/metabolite transporter (DMT)-like permease